eukprot:4516173-Pyramimonas_sp.AAC.1
MTYQSDAGSVGSDHTERCALGTKSVSKRNLPGRRPAGDSAGGVLPSQRAQSARRKDALLRDGGSQGAEGPG